MTAALGRSGAAFFTTAHDVGACPLSCQSTGSRILKNNSLARCDAETAHALEIDYHDVHASFPPAASHNDDDKPLLSWRVHVLPYIEQNELYKEFHLDEPWDSEHNKKLIGRMPAVYRTPNHPEIGDGKTVYLVPRGEGTTFEGFDGPRIQDITDGTSNTIMAVETSPERAAIWTAPNELDFDPEQPLAVLGGIHANGFLALFADGSVCFIAQTVDLKTLKALFTAAGGEVIGQ